MRPENGTIATPNQRSALSEGPEHNIEKVHRENFHSEAS
jgi:hypothetical protein